MAEYISASEAGYDLRRTIGVLSSTPTGKSKRVTLGVWSGAQETRLDIRKWSEDLNLGKGVSLNEDEVRELRRLLEDTDFGR